MSYLGLLAVLSDHILISDGHKYKVCHVMRSIHVSSPEFSGQIASQESEGNTAKHIPLPVFSKSSQDR